MRRQQKKGELETPASAARMSSRKKGELEVASTAMSNPSENSASFTPPLKGEMQVSRKRNSVGGARRKNASASQRRAKTERRSGAAE